MTEPRKYNIVTNTDILLKQELTIFMITVPVLDVFTTNYPDNITQHSKVAASTGITSYHELPAYSYLQK